jgi:predicted CXXCH cytochrome family protein
VRKIIVIISILMYFSLVFYGSGYARVSGPCSNCHTMHNSQNGSPVARGDEPWHGSGGSNEARPNLLVSSCLGCHSNTGPETIVTIGITKIPIVFNTGGYPDEPLAGGNFYWVSTDGTDHENDTKGHNIFPGNPDNFLTIAPGDPSRAFCGSNNCHANLSQPVDGGMPAHIGRQGCTKCHMMSDFGEPSGYHHADDSNTVVGSVQDDTDGFYRFLTAHQGGSGGGVSGIEDDNWEATPSATEHNEYLGLSLNKEARVDGMNDENYHTMTIYCCGCHGNFHVEQDGGAWVRHPSDSVIPDRDEYADAYGGTGAYDPQVPVARDNNLFGWTGPSATVTIGSDMVMCLSCHRPHGSPYPDMLRWDYNDMIAGDNTKSGGCFTCHTQKNQP